MMSWDEFRLVKAIADTGSLAGAAEALGVNHSTIFRRLGALEASLGARLFERGRNGYVPTVAGEEMIALAGRMADDVVEFERKVAGRDLRPSGELRVTTNDTFLIHLLTPIFAEFRKAYPEIRIDAVIGNNELNLSRRAADVAIRATQNPPQTLIGRRIASLQWAVYANAGLYQPADDIAAYRDAPWIAPGDQLAHLEILRLIRERVGERQIVYRLNTVLGMTEAVTAGIGVGFLPCYIADRRPELQRLVQPVPETASELWILTHPDIRLATRVRTFTEFMGNALAKRKRLLEGDAEK